MSTPDLLTSYEQCDRKGIRALGWKRRRLVANEFLQEGIRAGVMEKTRQDFGEVAGERIMDLAVDPGMEMPTSRNIHESVVHHAALADTLTTAIRKPNEAGWLDANGYYPSGIDGWVSGALLSPTATKLRRVVLATSWTDGRHYSEARSWQSLGEVAAYKIPMQMIVAILGSHRDGRRSGPWTRGFLHPQNHKLRFRKKSKVTSETFSDRWEQVWREDRGEITTWQWLEAMLQDDILRDVLFTVEIPVPGEVEVQRIRDMAARKLERLQKLTRLPEASLSVCDRPPCPFKSCCWSTPEFEPSEKTGFVSVKIGGILGGTPRHIGE